jgi:pimeloyl-ACP methyl ester carboxylesterase
MKPRALLVAALLLATMMAVAQEARHFDSAGVSLRYLEAGPGEPVLLLHGFSGSAEGLYLEPGTFDALVSAGYRVIALDQRGHGQSDKPHEAASYGLEMVEDIRRLLDHLDIDRAHLVGYSMGAKVANTFRQRHPDRLISITLGGYGWPWRSAEVSLDEARERLENRMVLPGNDLDALAAVSTGMSVLSPTEQSLRENRVPALAIIGDRDEVVPHADFLRLVAVMARVTPVTISGTHAGKDGAPYKPVFGESLIEFLTSLALVSQ